MAGVTLFGAFHTVLSLIAVVAGVIAFIRYREISPRSRSGLTYIAMTIASCVTGFFIFHHGGFGKPHALGIVTLIALAVAGAAGYGRFGRASKYIETAAYSATFFFHMIPGATETFTRLPASSPIFTGPDDPALQTVIGVVFVIFVIGLVAQLLRIRSGRHVVTGARTA